MSENFYFLLQHAFAAHPERAALLLADGREVSYRALDAMSERFAGLLGALGVDVGDRVLVQTDKSAETVGLYLGCLRFGAIYVPINTAYTAEEVAYFLEDAAPSLFVCRPDDEEAFAALLAGHRLPSVRQAQLRSLGTAADGSLLQDLGAPDGTPGGAGRGVRLASRSAADTAAILYTSGTTGRSKGAMLSHGNLATSAAVLVDFWGWRDDDVLLHALPIFHVHGLFVALHCALLTATPVIFLPGFDTEAVIAALPRATVMMGVPTFYTRLLGVDALDRSSCAHMRLFVSGSAPLTAQTFAAWETRTGHRILERYGMSETMMNTSNPLQGERLAGTVGYPLPGVALRIADASGGALPPGEVGVIEVKGPNVFSGYWQMPEKTAQEFRADGFFITGDQAVMDDTGRVSIVGREKDMVISGGYNVYPKEIETLIDEMPEVTESAVIGVPHPDFGEAVVAVVVPAGETVSVAQVDAALAGRLARFKQPKAVINLAVLPRNAMGKVQKGQLRADHGGLFSGASAE